MPPERVGLLIIRAWVEAGSSSPLRAQIRCTTDVGAGLQISLTLTDTEAIHAAVGTWLDDVLAADGPDKPE